MSGGHARLQVAGFFEHTIDAAAFSNRGTSVFEIASPAHAQGSHGFTFTNLQSAGPLHRRSKAAGSTT